MKLVDQNVVTNFARSPIYNWMQSLTTLRQFLKANPPKGCCGKPTVLPEIPQAIFNGIGADPRFLAELIDLRIKIGVPRLTVAVGAARFVIPARQ